MMASNETFAKAWECLRKTFPRYDIPENAPDNNFIDIRCRVEENDYGVPTSVLIRIEWNDNFPYGGVDAYSRTKELSGFPHQMAHRDKLCLDRSISEICDETLLVRTVKGVEDWLSAMSRGELVTRNDVYELPDFSFEGYVPDDFQYKTLVYAENESRFEYWKDVVGSYGICSLIGYPGQNIIVPRLFRKYHASGEEVPDCHFNAPSPGVSLGEGLWITLPDVCYVRHRPPKTWQELFTLAENAGIDNVRKLVRKIWERAKGDNAYVLIGWPIPDLFGGELQQMAWRACVFPSFDYLRRSWKQLDGYRRHSDETRAGALWKLSEPGCDNDYELHWLLGENVSHETLSARWKVTNPLRTKKILLLGCGAIGSMMAELLVRGGVENMTLVDGDRMEFGNLCRHILDDSSIGKGKASELCKRLLRINPIAILKSIDKYATGTENFPWHQYDLVIDCTANEKLCVPLSGRLRECNVQYLKTFIDADASNLVIASSGKMIRCDDVLNLLYKKHPDVTKGLSKVDSIMSPGCWHPTYPGRWSDISMLMGASIPALEGMVKDQMQCNGHAIVYTIDSRGLPRLNVLIDEDVF